jgi:transcriptional regulator with XRE-family HTH domain
LTPETTSPEVGQRLSAARLRRGWSQAAVARRAGIAPSYLSRIETGKIQPTYRTLMRIVHALHVEPEQIVGETPYESGARPCPISPDGRCMLDLIRSQTEVWRHPHGSHFSAREIRLLRRVAVWIRHAKTERLRAMEILLEDLETAAEEEGDGPG